MKIKDIAKATGLAVSVVEYTIAVKKLRVTKKKNCREINLEDFISARNEMRVGRPGNEKIDFDWQKLSENIKNQMTMKDFFRVYGISKSRFYHIRAGRIAPAKFEMKVFEKFLKA